MIRGWWTRSCGPGLLDRSDGVSRASQRKVSAGGDLQARPAIYGREMGTLEPMRWLRSCFGPAAMVGLFRNRVLTAIAAVVLVAGSATPVAAATISLGALFFDQFIPAVPGDPSSVGTNAFEIFNSTGGFASTFDATVPPNPVDPLSFQNASLLLTEVSGVTHNISIGTIDPGLLNDGFGNPVFDLQFADTTQFTSAVFTATLSALSFALSDGSTFTASSGDLLFTLAASGSNFLPNPATDPPTSIDFELTGDVVPSTPVPEPATLVLVVAGLCAGACRGLRRKRIR